MASPQGARGFPVITRGCILREAHRVIGRDPRVGDARRNLAPAHTGEGQAGCAATLTGSGQRQCRQRRYHRAQGLGGLEAPRGVSQVEPNEGKRERIL